MTPPEAVKPLRRQRPNSAWRRLLFRFGLAIGLILLTFSVLWLDRDGLKDQIDGSITLVDTIYFTMVTVTTLGYGDIVPVTDRAKLIDTFFIAPMRLFIWLIFLGTAYDFLFKRQWDKWRMRKIQATLSGHTVIAGYGRSGRQAVAELVARGTRVEEIVIVDLDPKALEHAGEIGVATLEGDATHNAVLEAVRLAQARALIISVGRDDTGVLAVLTARQLTRDVPISVVIRELDNEDLAHHAGATTVINPVQFTGLLLAGSTHGPHLADYLTDLARTDGGVVLRERTVRADEVGKPLAACGPGMGLRVYRNGQPHGFGELATERLEAGDTIIEAVPTR